mgnify:CR=1 FL=1
MRPKGREHNGEDDSSCEWERGRWQKLYSCKKNCRNLLAKESYFEVPVVNEPGELVEHAHDHAVDLPLQVVGEVQLVAEVREALRREHRHLLEEEPERGVGLASARCGHCLSHLTPV